MLSPAKEHLVAAFERKHRNAMEIAARDLPFLSGLHPDFIEDALTAYRTKHADPNAPSLGRVLPFLIAEGLDLDSSSRHRLAAAWLAVYAYILIADAGLDSGKGLSGRNILSASALLGWGLSTVAQITANTPFSDTYLNNISAAFNGQYYDVRSRDGSVSRARSDIDKNRAIVAMTAGYAAAAGEENHGLLLAIENLLGPLQMLDDLLDLEEDLAEGNITSFVCIVRSFTSNSWLDISTRKDIYGSLFASREFTDIVGRSLSPLEEAMEVLPSEGHEPLRQYLRYLHTEIGQLVTLLRKRQAGAPVGDPELYERVHYIICGT